MAAWVAVLTCMPAVAQRFPIIRIPGSPKNVRVLFQDSRGRLWLGGDQLACFDGVRFFFLSDYGFPAVTSYSLAEDEAGAIWVGAESGVYRFDRHVEQIASGVATSVIAVKPDLVLAALGPPGHGIPESASLVRIERIQKGWTTETLLSLGSPGPLTVDHSGILLYPAGAGWSELSLQDAVGWQPGSSLSVKAQVVGNPRTPGAGDRKVLRDRLGCVWLGSEEEIVYSCDGATWRDSGLAGLRAQISETPDGAVLLSGYGVVAVGRPGSFRVAEPRNGLPLVLTAIAARDGTV